MPNLLGIYTSKQCFVDLRLRLIYLTLHTHNFVTIIQFMIVFVIFLLIKETPITCMCVTNNPKPTFKTAEITKFADKYCVVIVSVVRDNLGIEKSYDISWQKSWNSKFRPTFLRSHPNIFLISCPKGPFRKYYWGWRLLGGVPRFYHSSVGAPIFHQSYEGGTQICQIINI